MKNKNEFAARLKEVRLSRNLTFEAMGKLAGVSGPTIYKLENAKCRANERTRYRIVQAFPELRRSA